MQHQIELEDKLYTSTQVADILGVSLRTLYRYMEDNKIQSMRTGSGRHRFTKDQILDFLNAGEMGNTMTASSQTAPMQGTGYTVASASPTPMDMGQGQSQMQNQQSPGQPQTQVTDSNQQGISPSGFSQSQAPQQQQQPPATQFQSDNISQQNTGQVNAGQFASQTPQQETSFSSSDSEFNNASFSSQAQQQTTDSQTPSTTDNTQSEIGTNLQSYLEQQKNDDSSQSTSDFGTPSSSGEQFGAPSDLTYNQQTPTTQQSTAPQTEVSVEADVEPQPIGVNTTPAANPISVQQSQPTISTQETVDISNNMNIRYYKSDYTDLIELAKKIKDTAVSRDLEYGFTLYAGVSLHFLIKPFTVLHYYANPEDVQLWKDELRLTPAQSKEDSNVAMVINTDIVFVSTKEIGGFKVVDDKVLLRDLTNIGDDELVMKFRQQLTSL